MVEPVDVKVDRIFHALAIQLNANEKNKDAMIEVIADGGAHIGVRVTATMLLGLHGLIEKTMRAAPEMFQPDSEDTKH